MVLQLYSEGRNQLQRLQRPPHEHGHLRPRLVEIAQLLLRADQREEHAELCAVHALQEPAEHVVVVQEVAPRLGLRHQEGLLDLLELVVEALEDHGPRTWRVDPRAALDDLQPLLNVHLQIQRSEYASDSIF